MQDHYWVTFVRDVAADHAEHPPGEPLAMRIREGLVARGIDPAKVEVWRDVGYSIDCTIERRAVYLFVSVFERDANLWALCCTSDLGFLGRLRHGSDQPQRRQLATAVDAVLRDDATVTDVRWYPHWQGRLDAPWTPHPS